MTARDYLSELHILDTIINQKLEELSDLRCASTSITVNIEGERIQSSGIKDRLGSIVTKIIDLEHEINDEIDSFVEQKHQIIKQIQGLRNLKHIKLLYMKYVQFKGFETIAIEMNYTYQYIVELHGRALKNFGTTYQNLLKTYE